jgi:hypothetical protein
MAITAVQCCCSVLHSRGRPRWRDFSWTQNLNAIMHLIAAMFPSQPLPSRGRSSNPDGRDQPKARFKLSKILANVSRKAQHAAQCGSPVRESPNSRGFSASTDLAIYRESSTVQPQQRQTAEQASKTSIKMASMMLRSSNLVCSPVAHCTPHSLRRGRLLRPLFVLYAGR